MEQADPGVQDSFVWDFIAQLMPAKENPPSIPSVSVPHSVHLDLEFTRPKPWPLGSWMDHRYALYTWIKASVQLAWTTGVHLAQGSDFLASLHFYCLTPTATSKYSSVTYELMSSAGAHHL